MIIPGTTVSVALLSTYVELRDKGIIKKKIKIKNRSFEDVLNDLNLYFRARGKLIANRVLRDTLEEIGVPVAKSIMVEEEIEPTSDQAVREEPEERPASSISHSKGAKLTPGPSAGVTKIEEEVAARFVAKQEAKPSRTDLPEDYDGITEALTAVERMSDTFMSPHGHEKEKSSPKIRINLTGEMEIRASSGSRASEILVSEVVEHTPATSLDYTEQELNEEDEAVSRVSPHQIKPLVEAKVLILGEKSVGKRSLMAKANLCPHCMDEDEDEVSKYIYERVFDTANHRVSIHVWCFDYAVESRIDRKTYYSSPDVLLIVYSASDRWSFESVDFWIREVAMTSEKIPPIVLVANKIDERSGLDEEWEEPPIAYEEGFKAAEAIAHRLGDEDSLHPVAFIETSCLTNQGVEDAFQTAADLYDAKISNT